MNNAAEQKNTDIRMKNEAPKAKKLFEKPTVEFIHFDGSDVIATSGGTTGGQKTCSWTHTWANSGETDQGCDTGGYWSDNG